MTQHKRPTTVATFRLPRSDVVALELCHQVRQLLVALPRSVVTIRRDGERGALYASRNFAYTFEHTAPEPAPWMEQVCRWVAYGGYSEGQRPPLHMSRVGHVPGQQELEGITQHD